MSDVIQNFKDTETLDDALCKFIEGDVCETLLESKNLPDKIALLRLDTDWYASTRTELEVLYPKISSGGILIVDDYGHWLGARKAVNEFFGKDLPPVKELDYTAIMLVKP